MESLNRTEADDGFGWMIDPYEGFNPWLLPDDLAAPAGESFSERQTPTAQYDHHGAMQLLHQSNDFAIVDKLHCGSFSPIEEQYNNQPPDFSVFPPRFDLVEGNTYTQGQCMSGPIGPTLFSWPSQQAIPLTTHSLILSDFHGSHGQSPILAQPEYATPLVEQELTQQQESPESLPDQIDQVARRERKRKNPEDLQKTKRKELKPVKCSQCGKGHPDTRDMERHMVSSHRAHAAAIGLDVSKIKCRICGEKFDSIRSDRLTRHMNKQHPLH